MKMNEKYYLIILITLMLLCSPGISNALTASYSDLWDVSNGTTVTGTSGALYYSSSYRSDIQNMFGGTYGTIEVGNTLFKDHLSSGHVPSGYLHYVEWETINPITLRSFNLLASNEGMNRRAFDHFQLFVGDGSGNWSSIYDLANITTYDDYNGPTYTNFTQMELAVDLTTPLVNAQYFRAEFTQAPWNDSTAIGPRIWELDGYDTFLDGSTGAPVPEPTTMLLLGSGIVGFAGFRKKFKKA